MSLQCRQTRSRLAWLAILVAITMALLACGAGPGATKTQDPVGFKNIELRQDSTSEISLVNTFSGSDLTFSAASNRPAVATVTVDNDKDTLTVEAVGAGSATITVTAANSQGSASQTFTVTVPEPEEEEAAPTVRPDARASVVVDQGQTETVALSGVFTGENLTFEAESSDTGVATASVSSGTLSITAVSPGTATVTVTATNAQGNVEHEIAVTASEPEDNQPTRSSANLTIELNRSAKHTLASGQTLETPAGGGVEVEPSPDGETGNVWLITALKKGTHTIAIFSGGATPEKVGSIVVEVPNSPPVRKHDVDHPKLPTTGGIEDTNNLYNTVTSALDLYSFFNDPDGDELRFRVGGKPSWVLINSKDGFVKTANTEGFQATDLTFEVLEKPADKTPAVTKFDISLYAVDDSGSISSRPVIITLPAAADMTPRKRAYSVQQASNGNLGTLEVGPRLGVDHTVTFNAPTGETGFAFANDLVERWKDHLNDGQPAGIITEEPSPAVGSSFFAIKASDGIVAAWDDPAFDTNDGTPKVTLNLEKARSGWIDIEYTLWKATDPKAVGGNSPPTDDTPDKVSAKRRLTVRVVTCSSPPNPLSDCPGEDPS